MAEGLGEAGKEQPSDGLIPGLPDELALECLAHLSHGHEGILQSVSKRWRDAIRGEDLARIRAREGLSGDWLFLLTDQRPAVCWRAYDPSADRWRPLPPAPGFSPPTCHSGFRCVVLHHRLLVLGGCRLHFLDGIWHKCNAPREELSDQVLCFDPFLRRWSELAVMKTPRVDFACAAVGGRILVAGGGGGASAESFDLTANRWEALPEMPEALQGCRGLAHDGRFHVLGRGADGPHRHFVFDVGKMEWEAAPAAWEFRRLDGGEAAEMGGRLYGILDEGLAVLESSTGGWRVLDEPPLFDVPGHSRRLPPSGSGFVGLRGRLYLVGGVGVRYNVESRVFTIVKFAASRYCDPSTTPVRWHDAQPLFRAHGAVLACATLQQE